MRFLFLVFLIAILTGCELISSVIFNPKIDQAIEDIIEETIKIEKSEKDF